MQDLKSDIQQKALELGFMSMTVAKAEFLDEEANYLENWLLKNAHGKMQYMENYFDKRTDPRLLVPGAKSVISLAFNYYSEAIQRDSNSPKISKYAWGEDYHLVIKEKLYALLNYIKEIHGEIDGRVFVDSAPVMEKAWAKKSGLGWIGKNTNLLNKKNGSFFFLAEIISDLELETDPPASDHCGTCTKCIDACPTDALKPYEIEANKCISYLTIELREAIPKSFENKMENWAFGCDICQDVCPWNRFSKPHKEERFGPRNELLEMNQQDWTELTKETFSKVFKKSAVKTNKI